MSDFKSDSGKLRKALLKQARNARQSAYCRYSNFAVGAALLTESGMIYTGCNIENASYSLCICAERVAFARAIAEGHRNFSAIAIAGKFQDRDVDSEIMKPETDCFPCGACRQFMSEFCQPDFKIYLEQQEFTLGELFPGAFKL
ncbi:MAG: cytidine deaminase [Oscillospiraceae bacterium]|nr:cytidine deaminase [Oscillospiraceae bacterium]